MKILFLVMFVTTVIYFEIAARRAARGNFRPIFVFEYSDELTLARVRCSRRLREWAKSSPREGRCESDLPSNPVLRLAYTADAFTITPVEDRRQVALCLVARMLLASGWRVSNSYLIPNFAGMPLHLRIAGVGALQPGKHWLQQRFRDPIVIRRVNQTNLKAFDLMTAALARNSELSDFHRLMTLSHYIIRETIPPQRLAEYDRAWR